MGLREAMLEVAEQIEEDIKEQPSSFDVTVARLRSYIRQLRSACKASEGIALNNIELPHGDTGGAILLSHGLNPDGPAKAAAKRLERAAEREDGSSPRMVELIDGSDLTEYHGIASDMPVGAKTLVGKKVFVLARLDNGTLQLHYSPEETAKVFPTGGK